MEEMKVTLQYPVKLGKDDEPITELVFRTRPKGKHLRAMGNEKSDEGKGLRLIGDLASVPQRVVDELDAVDIEACLAVVDELLGKSRATGATS